MNIKNCIVFLYDKEQKFIAAQIVKNLENCYKDNYIVPIDDGAFITSVADKNKKKIKSFMVKSNAFLYKMTERAAERKVNSLVKKQRKNVNKLDAPQMDTSVAVDEDAPSELISTNDNNDKKEPSLTKKQKLMFDRLNNVINIYHRFAPQMLVTMSKKSIPMLAKARELLKVKFDIVCIVPDFALDAQYVNFEITKYLVTNAFVKEQLEKYGINESIIEVTGLVATDNIGKTKSSEIKSKLNIKNELPVLLINGAEVKINYLLEYFKKITPYSKKMNIFVYTGESAAAKKFAKYLAGLDRVNKKLTDIENGTIVKKDNDDKLVKVDYERANIKFFSRETDILDNVVTVADIIVCTPDTINIYYGIGARVLTVLVAPFTHFDKKNIAYALDLNLLIEAVGVSGIGDILDKLLDGDEYRSVKLELEQRLEKIKSVALKGYIGGING